MVTLRIAPLFMFFLVIQTPSQESKASVEGRVVRYGTIEPLSNARVVIGKPTILQGLGLPLPDLLLRVLGDWVVPGTSISTVTDAAGRFRFPDVQPGEYIVFAGGDAFASYANDRPYTGRTSDYVKHITLRPGEPVRDVALSLFTLARIRGVVRGSDGQPIGGINVSIGYIEYPDGHPEWQEHGEHVKTNNRGEYQLDNIRPGHYYIAAAFDRRDENPDSRGAYFPRSLTTSSATLVPLTNGSDITGNIEVETGPAAGRTVSGKALKGLLPQDISSGAAVLVPRGKDVLLRSPVCSVREVDIDASGEFQIKNVHAGTYELYVIDVQQGRTYLGSVPVVVGDKDVNGLSVTFDKGAANVAVRITENGAQDNPQVELVPRMGSVLLSSWCSDNSRFSRGPAEPLRVTYKGVLPGTYDLVVRPVDGQFVADVRQEGQSIFDSGLVIEDAPPAPITVTLRQGGGAIRVRTLGDRARSGVLILTPDPLSENPSLYRDINTRGSSSFTFENLRPGRYKVFAFEHVLNLEELNPDYFTKYSSEGVSVTVRDGETVNARVSLIPK